MSQCICLAFTAALTLSADATAKAPNVVFLLADDMRPDAIAALGHPVVKTPALDALVGRGFTFHNAYCMGSTMGAVCNPSRHMLLSGRSLYRYDPKRTEGTFADLFRKAGYLTRHLGKKGNVAREYNAMFEFNDYLDDQKERTSGHHGRTAANRAIEFLRTGWDRNRPLCLYLAFEGPHDPRVAAEEWMSLYQRDAIPLPESFAAFHPIDNGWLAGRDETLAPWPRTPNDVRKHLHDYYACISSIDHNCGRILDALRSLGELDNTVVVFSSDHGLAVGSHGLFGKQNLYEHSMRSPLIFAGPGIPQGASDAFTYLFDIYPTIADLCGLQVPADLEGRSQGPVMRGEKPAVRDTIFLSFEQGQRAVRHGDWKLYRFPLVNHSLLFNLKNDPHERQNLAGDPSQAQRLTVMTSLLAEQQLQYDDPQPLTSSQPGTALIDLSYFDDPPQPKPAQPRAGSQPRRRPSATTP